MPWSYKWFPKASPFFLKNTNSSLLSPFLYSFHSVVLYLKFSALFSADNTKMSEAESVDEEQFVQDYNSLQFVEVCVALKQVFTVPFRDFSTAWKDNVLVPSADAEVKQMVANNLERFPLSLRKDLITNVMTFLEATFIVLRVKTFLTGESDDEEFLNLFSAFIDYYEQACSVVHELFANQDTSELQNELGNRTIYKYLRYYGLRTLYLELKPRLKRVSLERVKRVRGNFRYTSSLFYEALTSPSFAKVTTGFQEFFATEEYNNCMAEFRQDAIDRVNATLETKFLHGIQGEEKRFLVTLKSCVDTEKVIFKELYRPTPMQVYQYCQELNTAFCVAHIRREQAGLFEDYKKVLVIPEVHFDPAIFLGLITMYSSSEVKLERNFQANLECTIRDLFKRIFRQNSPDHLLATTSGWPMEHFRTSLENMADRNAMILARIGTIRDPGLRAGIKDLHISGCTELWNDGSDDRIDECNIVDAQKFVINYISSVDNEDEEEFNRLKLIGLFFQFLADRGWFMAKLFERLQRAYLNSERLNLDRLISFRELREVNACVPSNIDTFIKDVTESYGNCRIIREEVKSSEDHTTFGSSLVFKKVDWKALKDMENLLTIPEQLMPIRNRIESCLKEIFEPKKEIRAVNALAKVTIRTRLFTGKKRPFTRIHLLLYQAMVLNLLEKKPVMTVGEIYEALIREDIPAGSDQRKKAEDVVNRLIESLREPAALLITAFDATDPDPSKNVYINRNFVFDEEEVSLPGQTVLGENPQYSE